MGGIRQGQKYRTLVFDTKAVTLFAHSVEHTHSVGEISGD